MKEIILDLRKQGLSYRQIEKRLGCSKALISYHCKPEQPIKSADRQRRLRRERKKYFVDLFGGKCVKCGYSKSVAALEFHHENGDDKLCDPSKAIKQSLAFATEEMKKCILVCANCHREIHEELGF